jgi:hypothetical protein
VAFGRRHPANPALPPRATGAVGSMMGTVMFKRPSDRLRGEAITLWRLERPADALRCFLVGPPRGYWLGIERGRDLIFSETYRDLDDALERAEALKSPLVVSGWLEVDDDDRPARPGGADA